MKYSDVIPNNKKKQGDSEVCIELYVYDKRGYQNGLQKAVIDPNRRFIQGIELEVCPFCGHEALAERGSIYAEPTYRITCSHCHSTSNLAIVGTDVFGRTQTHEECLQSVINAWNIRKPTTNQSIGITIEAY